MKNDMANKFVATNSVQTLAALCEKQDETLSQILAVARLAGYAVQSRTYLSGKVAEDVEQALVLIVQLVGDAINSIDMDCAKIEEARFLPDAPLEPDLPF